MLPISISESTEVTYPVGEVLGTSTILTAQYYSDEFLSAMLVSGETPFHAVEHPEKDPLPKALIITAQTPFHPVDHTWADQPADLGSIDVNNETFRVVNVLTGVLQTGGSELLLDKDIPVKKGAEGWIFVVAHIIELLGSNFNAKNLIGKEADLKVDTIRRQQLSAAHSACHVSALALNKCTTQFWRKEAMRDSLGNPNLDQLAIQTSKIKTTESIDYYRFGKSLRKQGLETGLLIQQIKEVESLVNSQLEEWVRLGAEIRVDVPNLNLESRRWWLCQLPEGLAKIPCGGTHVSNLREFSSIKVEYELIPEKPEIIVHTIPTYIT